MKLLLDKIKAGTILNGKVTDTNGSVLFSDRILFTRDVLKKLGSSGVREINYYPVKNEKANIIHDKEEENAVERIIDGFHFGGITRDVVKNAIASFRTITNNLLTGNDSIDFSSCKHSIQAIYEKIKANPSALINLLDIKNHDDYTFCHSINVGIISLALAHNMGYPDEEVELIGLGGILHDIGKLAIPASLINKTTILSEEEKRIMKSHPSHSYRIMRLDKNIHPRIINMAYEHHERYDGKGYPRGISGDTLDDYSVIVALADVYDALTTVRSYKPAFSPEESIQIIETYTGTHFAPRIAEKFITDIQHSFALKTQYSKGTLVLLNTGELGQIVYNKQEPDGQNIIVNILTTSSQGRLKNPFRVHLKEDKTRSLKRKVNPEEIDGDSLRISRISSTNL